MGNRKVLWLKLLGQELEYSKANRLYEPRREIKTILGFPPAYIHVNAATCTETNSSLSITDWEL